MSCEETALLRKGDIPKFPTPHSQLSWPGWLKKVWKPQKVENKLVAHSIIARAGPALNSRWQRPELVNTESVMGVLLGDMSGFWPEVLCRAECPLASLPSLGGRTALRSAELLSCPLLSGSHHFPHCWVVRLALQSPACCYSCMASCSTDCSEGARYFSWRPRVEEKWKSAPIAADIMASRLRCSWTPKQ